MTSTPEPAIRDAVLVDPGWLEAHLHDPSVRVVEVDVSRRAYDEWHIDGAVLWNVYTDLKDADYRLADAAALQQLFARSGIRSDSTVVFYGYAPAMGFWLMKLYGHADVRILDCSRGTWQREDRPRAATAAEPRPPGTPSPARTAGFAPITPPCGTVSPTRASASSTCALGRVPRRAILALRRHGTGRPRGTHPLRGPPAH